MTKLTNPYEKMTVKYLLWDLYKEAEDKQAIKKKKRLSESLKAKKVIKGPYLVKRGNIYVDVCSKSITDQLFIFPRKQILALKGCLKEFSDYLERYEMIERKRAARLRAKKAIEDGNTMTFKNCFIPIG
jgi:hypothetical protein